MTAVNSFYAPNSPFANEDGYVAMSDNYGGLLSGDETGTRPIGLPVCRTWRCLHPHARGHR